MSDQLRPQRRGRRLAMSQAERDRFLDDQRTCRVATVGRDGPHATPLWYVWDGSCVWLYSIVRSRRWADLMADPRIALVVDAGTGYEDIRGVEITGTVAVVGEVPRVGEPNTTLEPVEAAMARRYRYGPQTPFELDGKHAWLRVTPDKIVSWDFTKITAR